MQIDIQSRNFQLTGALRSHTERRLSFALSAKDDLIQRVIVRLSNINGPQGGANKCCHIQVILAHQSDVVIKDTDADLYTAIDRAVKEDAKYRYTWLVRFCHPAVIDSYRDHPAHVAFADNLFRPVADERISIDYQTI